MFGAVLLRTLRKEHCAGTCIEKREVYCCYKSPLSRIVNEQVRLQGNILSNGYDGWVSPEHPKCQGVPLEKVDRIDWDRIELSEWTAILLDTGNLPSAQTIGLESLTGVGSSLDLTSERHGS